jgi:leader peptidase (prepilin peptidase)/N-methyltransferase
MTPTANRGPVLVGGRDLTAGHPGVRLVIVAVTIASVAAVATVNRGTPILAALLSMVVIGYGALSAIDAAEQRLPNRLTLPLAGLSAAAVVADGLLHSGLRVALAALGFGLAFALVLLVLRFGMGDVKLALTVGLIAAWLGPDAIITTVYVGAGSGAAVALALLVIHRRRRLTFSFGPFLAIGSVAGMVTAGL